MHRIPLKYTKLFILRHPASIIKMLSCTTITTSINNFKLNFGEEITFPISFQIINEYRFSNISYLFPIPLWRQVITIFYLTTFLFVFSIYFMDTNQFTKACHVIKLPLSSTDTKYINNMNQYKNMLEYLSDNILYEICGRS